VLAILFTCAPVKAQQQSACLAAEVYVEFGASGPGGALAANHAVSF